METQAIPFFFYNTAESFIGATFSFSSPIKEQISIKHLWVNYSRWAQVASYYTGRHYSAIASGNPKATETEGVGSKRLT